MQRDSLGMTDVVAGARSLLCCSSTRHARRILDPENWPSCLLATSLPRGYSICASTWPLRGV
jgi:hypothetical protein